MARSYLKTMISSPLKSRGNFCIELAIHKGHFDLMMGRHGVSAMMKPLIEVTGARYDLGVTEKWKSWNTIVTQADSGESRISAGAAEPESRFERARGSERASAIFHRVCISTMS